MERKILYRVITFEAKSCQEIDNLVNTFLREEADITAISVSHAAALSKEDGKDHVLYTATILYSFMD